MGEVMRGDVVKASNLPYVNSHYLQYELKAMKSLPGEIIWIFLSCSLWGYWKLLDWNPKNGTKFLLIGGIYRHPSHSQDFHQRIENSLWGLRSRWYKQILLFKIANVQVIKCLYLEMLLNSGFLPMINKLPSILPHSLTISIHIVPEKL